jgi:hypothetical protein
MEFRSILVAALTIYCGLYYLTGKVSDEGRLVLFILMLVGNTYFLLYWFLKATGALFVVLSKKMP